MKKEKTNKVFIEGKKPEAVVISKEILDTEPLSKEETKNVEQGLKDISEGKTISNEEIKERIRNKKKDGRKNNKGRPKQIKEKIESIEINKFNIDKKYILLLTLIGVGVLIYWKRDYVSKIFDTILLKFIERKEKQIQDDIAKGG